MIQKKTFTLNELFLIQRSLNLIVRIEQLNISHRQRINSFLQAINAGIQAWEAKRKEIFDKYKQKIPDHSFIAMEKYPEFKKRLLEFAYAAMGGMIHAKDIEEILNMYEAPSPFANQEVIPLERGAEHQKELDSWARRLLINIEFTTIKVDKEFEEIFKMMLPEVAAPISFLFEFSPIIIPGQKLYRGN